MTDFVAAAEKIGTKLVDEVLTNGGLSTWHSPAIRSDQAVIGFDVYSGSAGVALFLAELFGVTGNKRYAATAESALRYAVHVSPMSPLNAHGFATGIPGLAYVAARYGYLANSNEWLGFATKVVEQSSRVSAPIGSWDFLRGLAGTIVAFLGVATFAKSDAALREARRLGERLLNGAARQPKGWSWPREDKRRAHDRIGFSHGASGCAFSLLELFAATQQTHYCFAASQAFEYERAFYVPARGNWLSLDDSKLLFANTKDEVVRVASMIKKSGVEQREAIAWCHGAPGIGLARFRAYELTANPLFADEGVLAAQTTQRSLPLERNDGLCHGRFGNCDTLIEASHALRDETYLQSARCC